MIRILIADNNVEWCTKLTEFLNTQSDMTVIGHAYDGEQALQQIKLLEPDLVILDITMPHLDGMAVLERLHTLGLQELPQVIVMTALSREEIIQRILELGAQYFIVKPFDLQVLAERIRQFKGPAASSIINETRASYRHSPALTQEAAITRLLHEMGVPPHYKGYKYLRDAVLLVLRDEQLLGGALTSKLYPELAKKYDTTPGGVEAAIRNSVLACWEGGNREFVAKLTSSAGSKRKTFPTNSIVIAKIADKVRLSRHVG